VAERSSREGLPTSTGDAPSDSPKRRDDRRQHLRNLQGEIAIRAKLARQHVTGEPAVRRDRNSAVSIFDAESRYANASVATAVQTLANRNELSRLERCDVFADHVARGTLGDNSPFVQKVRPSAERGDGGGIVAHEQHGSPTGCDLFHPCEALLLEREVANREDLVHHQDLRLEMGRHREREPHVHPARVALDWRVDKTLNLRERHDLIDS
jgi:hypothetical protein